VRIGDDLTTDGLDRLLEHETGDLTCTVEAGMRLSVLNEILGRDGQRLSLDPPGDPTVGALLATNVSGPLRHRFGAPRDLVLGVTLVLADGTVASAGGKVVKNVAGYDLPKLFIGSWGTLGIVVDATFKLRPRPDDERLLAARFDRLKDCGAAARAVLAGDLRARRPADRVGQRVAQPHADRHQQRDHQPAPRLHGGSVSQPRVSRALVYRMRVGTPHILGTQP